MGDNLYAYFESTEGTITVTPPDNMTLTDVGAVWDPDAKNCPGTTQRRLPRVYTITLTPRWVLLPPSNAGYFTVSESLEITTTLQDVDAQVKKQFGSKYVPTGHTVNLQFSCVGEQKKIIWELVSLSSFYGSYPTGATITGSSTTGNFTFDMPVAAPSESSYAFKVKILYDGEPLTQRRIFTFLTQRRFRDRPRLQRASIRDAWAESVRNYHFWSNVKPRTRQPLQRPDCRRDCILLHRRNFGTTTAAAGNYTISVTATNNLDSRKPSRRISP